LAGNHDNTNFNGGKLRLTKFAADASTSRFTSVMYQDGGNQQGNTVLVSGCRATSATRGFKFQAYKLINFDDYIDPNDVDTLGYISRSGFNCTSGEYLKNGSQITYSDLAGTIATDQIGENQVTSNKVFSLAASKLTDTIATARLPNLNASQTTAGTFATAQIPSLPASQITSGTFDVARIPALPTSVLSDAATLVRTSGDQTVGGIKTYTASQINVGGLYTLGSVQFSGSGDRAITVQSANPSGGVNSSLRLVTADNADASNITYNTGVLQYNGTTSTMEMDKPLSVTGAITVKHPSSGATVATLNASSGAACQFSSVSASGGITSTTASNAFGASSFSGLVSMTNTLNLSGSQKVFVNGSAPGSAGKVLGVASSGAVSFVSPAAGLTAADLGAGGSLTLETLSVSNGGGGATAGMVIADGKITANDGVDIPTGHLSCTNGLKLLDGIQTYQAHVDASASQPRLWTGIMRLQAIMGANQIDATKVMKCNFVALPMNTGHAYNDYLTGTGHTATPQTKKYSNHYQTVFEGVTNGLQLFSKTQTTVVGASYSVNLALTSSDWTGSDLIINGTGYIYWAASSFPTSVSRKNNKLIRVGHYVDDAVRITIDGQPVVFTKYSSSMSISGTGQDNYNSVFVARGDWSALEIMYMAGGGGNYMILQFNVLAAWD